MSKRTHHWFDILIRWILSLFNARHKEYKDLKKILFSTYLINRALRCIKFDMWFFNGNRLVETAFNLSWSRPEANLCQDNPSLKHFGSAPRLDNESEHMEPSPYLYVKKKYGRLSDVYIREWKSSMQKKMHVGSLKQFKSFW